MDFSVSLFGKDVDDLVIDDINKYFKTPREESDVVEYKSYYTKNQNDHKHKENAILKTVCAFLNSGGGILIWGAPEEKRIKGNKRSFFEGELSPVRKDIVRDEFIGKVLNRIVPATHGIKFKRVRYTSEAFIYVIEVPESSYKPHQFDSRFWMRNDGQTNVAPYHYVEALFKQIKFPNLSAVINFSASRIDSFSSRFYIRYNAVLSNLSFYQNELNPKVVVYINDRHKSKLEGNRVLHFGEPVQVSGSLTCPAVNSSFEFVVRFGGEKSPIKATKYIVECSIVDKSFTTGGAVGTRKEVELNAKSIFEDEFIFNLE